MRESPPIPTILHQDEDLVVVAKPAGLATHPSPDWPDPVSCLSLVRDAVGRWVYPVHRLDRPTSGVLVFALSPAFAAELSRALVSQQFDKRYLAVVRGHLPPEGTIESPLDGKAATTRYRTLAVTEAPWPVRPYPTSRYALVELTPVTGRTNQLRRHLKRAAHPIVGDTRFGDLAHNHAFEERLGVRRLLLHAARLSFPDPRTGATACFEAALDEPFRRAMTLFPSAPR